MLHSRQGGFSLIEAIVAMGLTATVLVSIAGLFSIGGRQVRSGRSSSEALVIGRQILEEMSAGSFAQIWERFDAPGTFSTPSYSADTETNGSTSCAQWRSILRERLGPSARAAIRIDALTGTGAPPSLDAGPSNVRVTVTVSWMETSRARRIAVVTVRT